MRILHLTQPQFEVLYDVVKETISNISDDIEDTDLKLDDYEIYHVWKQLNNYGGTK